MGTTLIEQLYAVSKHELRGEPSNLWAELNVAITAGRVHCATLLAHEIVDQLLPELGTFGPPSDKYVGEHAIFALACALEDTRTKL